MVVFVSFRHQQIVLGKQTSEEATSPAPTDRLESLNASISGASALLQGGSRYGEKASLLPCLGIDFNNLKH